MTVIYITVLSLIHDWGHIISIECGVGIRDWIDQITSYTGHIKWCMKEQSRPSKGQQIHVCWLSFSSIIWVLQKQNKKNRGICCLSKGVQKSCKYKLLPSGKYISKSNLWFISADLLQSNIIILLSFSIFVLICVLSCRGTWSIQKICLQTAYKSVSFNHYF